MTTKERTHPLGAGWPWSGPATGPGGWAGAPEEDHQQPTPLSREAAASLWGLSSPTWSLSVPTPQVSKLHVFAPTVPRLKRPSSRKSSRPTKPDAAHDAPSGNQALPQGHTDPTEVSPRLPQRRPHPGRAPSRHSPDAVITYGLRTREGRKRRLTGPPSHGLPPWSDTGPALRGYRTARVPWAEGLCPEHSLPPLRPF